MQIAICKIRITKAKHSRGGPSISAMLWLVLNRISIPRSPMDILFRALFFMWGSCNVVARDVHSGIVMGHDIVMGAYHDVTMHTDLARTLI